MTGTAQAEAPIAAEQLTALNPESAVKENGDPIPSPHSLDPERDWLTVVCPNGHTCHVQDHQGGSVAHCDRCDARFTYGQSDVEITASDSATAGDTHA